MSYWPEPTALCFDFGECKDCAASQVEIVSGRCRACWDKVADRAEAVVREPAARHIEERDDD